MDQKEKIDMSAFEIPETLETFFDQHHSDFLYLMDWAEDKFRRDPRCCIKRNYHKIKISFPETEEIVNDFIKNYLSEKEYNIFESLRSNDKIILHGKRKSYIDVDGRIHLGLHHNYLDTFNYIFQFGTLLADYGNETSFLFGTTVASFLEDLMIRNLQNQHWYETQISRFKEIKYYRCYTQVVCAYLCYYDANMKSSLISVLPEVLAMFLKTKLILDYQNNSLDAMMEWYQLQEQIKQDNIEGALKALKINPILPNYELQDLLWEYVRYYRTNTKVLKKEEGVKLFFIA